MIGNNLVWLTPAHRSTTRAGFGCSGLMGALSRRESLALLEVAWDAGIRHFDVAPLYGHGEAEKVLGRFLQGRRDKVTLVTKFGLPPTGRSALLEVARAVARPLVRRMPALRLATPRSDSSPQSRAPITAKLARLSLERSLRALRTECIDVLLLHEPPAELLTDDDLLRFLVAAVQKGTIRTFGVGGDSRRAAALFRLDPRYCPLVQCEWSLLDTPPPSFPGSQLIVFGLVSRLRREPGATRFALRDGTDPAQVTLRAAAHALPESVILFSSRNRAHVASSAAAISDTTLDSAARQLLAQVTWHTGPRPTPGV